MSLDKATPAMWDAAARAARQMYHNKFEGTELQMPSVEYTYDYDTTDTQTFGPLEESKPVDFKAAQGIEKPRLDLIPLNALTYIALGLQEGARKYGSASWRDVDSVDLAQYVAATMRHLMAYADGEDTDPESGNPHLAHAMASLAIMVDLIENGNGADTRPAVAGRGPQTVAKYTRTTK